VTGRPEPLPPAERTVGQLIGESIRAYGGRFLLSALLVGVPVAMLDLVVAQFERPWSFAVAVLGGAVLVTGAYVAACALVLDVPREPRRFVLALAFGAVVFLPFPFLVTVFVLPGLAWFAAVGLGVPAILVEGIGLRAALRRGVRLGFADFFHALGSLAALAIVYFVARFGLAVLLRGQGEQTEAVAAFLSDVVVAPVLFIGSALLYVDQAARVVDSGPSTRTRVRRTTSRADLHPADDAHRPGRPDAQVEP
jgi:hypothetical protein